MHIREEETRDKSMVHRVNVSAFGRETEADLVDALREQATPVVSLVADDQGDVMGHIIFSPVTHAAQERVKIMGLGPMAVLPKRQKSGVGSQLVRTGLDVCRERGWGAVVVLGHPEFYPRFGFVPASRFGMRCEYKVPDEVFMAVELVPGCLNGASGIVRYHPAFSEV